MLGGVLAGIVLGAGLSYMLGMHFFVAAAPNPPVDVRADSPEYHFINPLLFSRTDKKLYAAEYKDLDDILSAAIRDATAAGKVASASIYFRDMNTSHWTGINENEKYDPSSMLKVAVMMAYLKDSIKDPEVLKKQLYYSGPDAVGQYYKPADALAAGYHSAKELIDAMIMFSDNVAMNALIKNDQSGFAAVYNDFRLPKPVEDSNDYMSARSYSVIFRSLYNSTYLPWDTSEQALRLLSAADFSEGLVAGVPKGIAVANKFGEHTYVKTDGSLVGRELHDCGIVYYPEHPYLLCVMTKGTDFTQQASVIAGISKQVYAYVQGHQSNK